MQAATTAAASASGSQQPQHPFAAPARNLNTRAVHNGCKTLTTLTHLVEPERNPRRDAPVDGGEVALEPLRLLEGEARRVRLDAHVHLAADEHKVDEPQVVRREGAVAAAAGGRRHGHGRTKAVPVLQEVLRVLVCMCGREARRCACERVSLLSASKVGKRRGRAITRVQR